jgi:cyanophycinase
MRSLLNAALLAVLLALAMPARADGSLVIVGGALRDDNHDVHRALLDAMPETGRLVIVPVASGRPWRTAQAFAQNAVRHGAAAERIELFPLAVRDDTSTEDVDESAWAEHAWNAELVDQLGEPAGFWFTGGDQMRIVETLRDADGRESPLLRLVRERLAAGAVVGGTSAGAAIMSQTMIAGGDSFRALLDPLAGTYSSTEDQDSGRLYTTRGLGFLPLGVIDQHFDRKARLGRLVRALAEADEDFGFGVDEDTALVVRLADLSARVVGRGSVSLLDARDAKFAFGGDELARGLQIGTVAAGERVDLETLRLVEPNGQATVDNEYYGYEPLQGGGLAFANARLPQLLGHDLLDNDATELLRLSVDDAGRMLQFRFTETAQSRGYWRRGAPGDAYSVTGVRFDIRAVRYRIEGREQGER